MLVGVDEAGRGPLAGPVVVASVVLDPKRPIEGVDDSKRLSGATRRALSRQIRESCPHNIAVITVREIEELNILGATMRGMHRCLGGFYLALRIGEAVVAVDGNIKIPEIPEDRQAAVVKGDAKSACIAAASIVAKVARDEIMEQEDARFPAYGFKDHKGYGSPRHIAAIRSLGLCEIHRPSFCRKFLP